MPSDIEKHRKHLAVIPPDVAKRRLEIFRLKENQIIALPSFCRPFTVKYPFTEYRKFVHPLEPRDLNDLKNWFGVPNETAKKMLKEPRVISDDGKLWSGVTQITPKALPVKKDWDFKKLDREERLAVKQMSKNLLYGYVTPEAQKSPQVKAVINHVLSSVKKMKLKVFAAQDLIICPNDVVEFHNIPALFFNNILIYGNGILRTSGNTSIHAFQIKRV